MSKPFSLTTDTPGTAQQNVRTRFLRNRGPDVLTKLLEDAGLAQGRWKFKIIKAFRASSHTPLVEVYRAEQYGVSLKVKPGDNASGLVGVLIADRDKGTPMEIYHKLRAVTAPESPHEVEKDGSLLNLETETARLLLLAIQSCVMEGRGYQDRDDFVRAVVAEIGPEESPMYWHDNIKELVALGMITEERTVYQLTDKGERLMSDTALTLGNIDGMLRYASKEAKQHLPKIGAINGNHIASLEPESLVTPVVPALLPPAPVLAPVIQATVLAPVIESVDETLQEEQLLQAAAMVKQLRQNRDEQKKLQDQLAKLKADEARIRTAINLPALSQALSGLHTEKAT